MMKTRSFLLTPLAWACVTALAQTLPTGGNITLGRGSLAVNGATLTVQQTSPRLVADWQSFSIGAGNTVRFVQPSSSSVALNRVLGSDPSHIFGSLTANGQVYLQNAAGVLFAPGAQVDVGGLVATSLNADARQFMAGHLSLSGADDSAGAVRNAGHLRAATGGYVVLAAPQVANSGHIDTPRGTAALVAGSAVTIDPTGSGLLNISVPVAAVNASLRNSGRLRADGGVVSLQAAATDAALRSVMQVGGVVRARSIEERDGQILLSGGASGVVAVSARLDASGHGGEHGGTVQVLGERVALVGPARVDVSGDSGGGTALVGGNYQGKGAEQNAIDTVVGSQVLIDASARRSGDGGTVVVWADDRTRYTGRIRATGGAQGGNGGQVEVSGKDKLHFDGRVDLRAARGQRGTLLLDPATLEIGTVTNLNGDATADDDLPASGELLFAEFPGANSQITATRVAELLETGNVKLEATVSMTVSETIEVTPGGTASTLTLNSPLVDINAALTLRNASLKVDTNQDFNDGIQVTAPISSSGSISLTSSNIFLDDAGLTAPNVTLTSRGGSGANIGQTALSGIRTTNLVIDRIGGVPSTVRLDSTLNQAATLNVSASSATLVFTNPAGQRLELRGGTDTLNLTTNFGLTQGSGAAAALTVTDNFTLTTTGAGAVTGAVTLDNLANSFGGGVVFDVGSSLDLRTSGALGASGTAGRDIKLVAAGGPFNLNGNISSLGTGGPANIDISGNGVNLGGSVFLTVPTGGRLLIRSTNWLGDQLGVLSFGAGAGQINHVLFGGWAGAEPSTGNVYVTDRTGAVTVPISDAPAVNRVYDGTRTFTYTQTGAGGTAEVDNVEGPSTLDSLTAYTVNSGGTFLNKNADINKGYTVADSNDVVATGLSGALFYGLGYTGFTRPAGVLGTGDPGNAVSVVTPRAITSSGITGVNRVYDGTTGVALNVTAATLSGVIGGDVVDVAGGTGSVANKNADPGKAVTIEDVTLTGADKANYTATDASGATVDIARAPLIAAGITGVNRVYDSTTGVALNVTAATLSGVIGSDVVDVTGGTGNVANKNADTGKAVTVSTLTLGGADAGNYSATDSSGASVTITRASVFASGITGVNRAYDGTVKVALDTSAAALSGVIGNDDLSLATSGATGTVANKNAGLNKRVTVTGTSLSGADEVNYQLVDSSAPPTVDIAALALTASGINALPRVVNGSTVVTLDTRGATLPGVLTGDVVVLDTSAAAGKVDTPAAGVAKPVTVTGLQLTGADAVNYAILPTVTSSTGAPLTVRLLTVAQQTFEEVRYKEYLQGLSDAQEPFRRAMIEALAAGFGKENIRKQLSRGLVFETGLAAPAVDRIESPTRPASCVPGGAGLSCAP